MPSRIRDRNIWLIYAATVLLTIAYGVAVAVLAVFLKGRGYTKPDIGELATVFASGIVIFALPMGKVIKRVSARTTLTVSLLGYAVVIAAFNAGPAPVGRWKYEVRDQGDPLLFIESIPYWETRAYVGIILRNYWVYQQMAGSEASSLEGLSQNAWPRFPGMSGTAWVRMDGPQKLALR